MSSLKILSSLAIILLCHKVGLAKSLQKPYWNNKIGQSGPNHWVWSLAEFDDGNGPALYAAGWFHYVGTTRVNHIAKWDGVNWHPLGDGLNGFVRPLAVFDDGNGKALYAGGHFTHADGTKRVDHIAKWDGKDWSPVGNGLNGHVQGSAMIVFNDGTGPALYVGGSFTRAGHAKAPGIAKWTGKGWLPVGEGVRGARAKVTALQIFNDGTGDALYVGGEFEMAGDVPAKNIAKWDGREWHPLGTGLRNGTDGPKTMVVFDDGTGPALYVGGFFTHAEEKKVGFIAKWDGQKWSGLNNGLDSAVRALAIFNDGSGDALYAAGMFRGSHRKQLNGIAKWDGRKWSPLDGGLSGEAARGYALLPWNDGNGDALYVGGIFTRSGNKIAGRISSWASGEHSPRLGPQNSLTLSKTKPGPAEPQTESGQTDPTHTNGEIIRPRNSILNSEN